METKNPFRHLFLCLGFIATFAVSAAAQTAVVEQISAFRVPFTVIPGAVAQLPDGRVYGFYDGGLHGAIYQVVADGSGGYSNVVVYEYGPSQAGPARPFYSNVGGTAASVGAPDGWIYYVGNALSRFNPDTGVVEDLQAVTSQPTQLSLGIDGQTLFGSLFDGRIFRYDIATATFAIVTTLPGQLRGVMQMKDGNLIAVTTESSSSSVMHRVDPLTGVQTGAIVYPNSLGYAPAKGDDGEIYTHVNVFGDRRFDRIDTACFCAHLLYQLPHQAPYVSSITGARNGALYLNVNEDPHRLNIAVNPPRLERLAAQGGFLYQLLQDGTLVMSLGNNMFALNTNTAVPDASPIKVFAAGMDNDGGDSFPDDYTLGADGMLYGWSANPRGQFASLFRIDPNTKARALLQRFDFGLNTGGYGSYPDKMVLVPDGRLFGTFTSSGTGAGVIFSFDPPTNLIEIVKQFPVDPSTYLPGPDGALPQRLTLGSDGWVYGATLFDADYTGGTIFKIDPSTGAFVTVAHPVDPVHGFNPTGALFEASPGVWLGSFQQWNPDDWDVCNRWFRFDAGSNTITTINEFLYETDGCGTMSFQRTPDGRVFASNGGGGAPDGAGNVLRIDPISGSVTRLTQFTSTTAIGNPYGDLLLGADGLLYSMYMKSEPNEKGLFRVDPDTGVATHLAFVPEPVGFLGVGTLFGSDGRVFVGHSAPYKLFAIGTDAIHVAPASGPFGGTTSLSARLTSIGVAMAGRSVGFTLNGLAVGTATTDADGVATINGVSLNGIAAGAHAAAIGASFAGDTSFPAASASGPLSVIAPPPPTVPQLLESLLALVDAVDPAYGLHAFVGQAQQAVAANRSADACAALSKLQAQVDRKATKPGKVKLTTAQAAAITAANAAARAALGCS